MSTIYLVRHGEASGDEETDPGLSPAGRVQVEVLARHLSTQRVRLVLHGPKRRARETAEILSAVCVVARRNTDLLDDRTPVPSARDRHFYSDRALEWLKSVPENERDLDSAALAAAWKELRATVQPDPVVFVTHSFVISQFVSFAIGAGPASWMNLPVSNAGLTHIEIDDRGSSKVLLFNQVVGARQ